MARGGGGGSETLSQSIKGDRISCFFIFIALWGRPYCICDINGSHTEQVVISIMLAPLKVSGPWNPLSKPTYGLYMSGQAPPPGVTCQLEKAFYEASQPCALQRKSHLCIPTKGNGRPQSQFSHSCVCERFKSVHIFSYRRIGRPIRSQTH